MTNKKLHKSSRELFLLQALCFILYSYAVLLNMIETRGQHFIYLAQSFLHGKLYFLENFRGISVGDMVYYSGHLYWPLGPFPALLLVPFVFISHLLHFPFLQGMLSIILVPLVFFFIYLISRDLGYSECDSWYAGIAGCGGSAFIGVAYISYSYYVSHVITVLFLFVSIYLSRVNRYQWAIGLFVACLFLTRATAGLSVVYFLLIPLPLRTKITICLFFFGALILSGSYNILRFGSLFEQGYRYQILLVSELWHARSIGMFSWLHIPGNLYYLLLSFPLPVFSDEYTKVLSFPYVKTNPWGMSIFCTSPYLLWLLFHRQYGAHEKIIWISIVIICLPILMYYGIGYTQFGYRYGLDFFPFLFYLFLLQYKKIQTEFTMGMKALFILSSVFNLYLLLVGVEHITAYNEFSYELIHRLTLD